jgi:hypothetical protein
LRIRHEIVPALQNSQLQELTCFGIGQAIPAATGVKNRFSGALADNSAAVIWKSNRAIAFR